MIFKIKIVNKQSIIIRFMNQDVIADIKFTNEEPITSEEAHPWMSAHTLSITDPIVRFHNQIIDFANYIEPDSNQHASRLEILESISTSLKLQMPDLIQVTNPLLKNKLYLKHTELEVFAIFSKNEQNWQHKSLQAVNKIAQKLELKIYNLSIEVGEQQSRIILQHQPTKTEIWIRFLPESWKLFIDQIDNCIAQSLQIKYLYLVMSCMVRQRSLQTAIRSLLIYGMCGLFLYQRRKQRVRTLTENIIKFLQFYSIGFIQQKERKVTYKEGNVYNFSLSNEKIFSFEIADKVDLVTRKMRDFLKIIHNRYRVLGNYYYGPGTSILAHLINPCFGKFFY